ncbi:MAG TPA: hypothetical protein VFR23_24890, partial [Jiangellaceae bacterium]|nr:hypothetical protein [Jiangellaceae bacterium]
LAAIECTATPAAAPGTMFALHRLLAAGSLEINLDIVLDGDDPAGAQALHILPGAVNTPMECSYLVEEHLAR